MQTFSFSSPINLVEESKSLLGVSSFECTNPVSNTAKENNSFLINILDHWDSKSAEKPNDELNIILELRYLELHVKEVKKRGNQIKIGDEKFKLSDFDTQKNEIIEELKNVNNNDLEVLVSKLQLIYDEILDILDLKFVPTKK